MPETPPAPRIRPAAVFGFALVHVAALGVFWVGFSWQGLLLCLASYYLRMFGITAGFHRYFSHRAYRLSRVPQFLLAFLGQTAAQKGVLWWAAHHRHHHRFSDQAEDIHSPVQKGFWWSHMGWILSPDHERSELEKIPDMARFPELVWLDRNQFLAPMLYAVALFLGFSWTGVFWGFFLSTVLLWHGTFCINSVMHVFGRRVFETRDTSRNSFLMAVVTMGEGWHNNHHHYPGSAAQGFLWWQVDFSYYLLWLGTKVAVVKELRPVPERLRTLARERSRWFRQAQAAFGAAHDRFADEVEALGARWAERRASARLSAGQALADLEAARVRAVERLEQLQADYSATARAAAHGAWKRSLTARAAAELRLEETKAEIERTRRQLAETLERLLAAVEGVPA